MASCAGAAADCSPPTTGLTDAGSAGCRGPRRPETDHVVHRRRELVAALLSYTVSFPGLPVFTVVTIRLVSSSEANGNCWRRRRASAHHHWLRLRRRCARQHSTMRWRSSRYRSDSVEGDTQPGSVGMRAMGAPRCVANLSQQRLCQRETPAAEHGHSTLQRAVSLAGRGAPVLSRGRGRQSLKMRQGDDGYKLPLSTMPLPTSPNQDEVALSQCSFDAI